MRALVVVVLLAARSTHAASCPCEGDADVKASCSSFDSCFAQLAEMTSSPEAKWFRFEEDERALAVGLSSIEPPPVARLIDVVEMRTPRERAIAAYALARIGPAARAAVPVLIKHIDERFVPYALAEIGDLAALPVLLARVEQGPASGALAKLGLPAAHALVTIFLDEREDIRRRYAAGDVLERMPSPVQAQVLPLLLRGLAEEQAEQTRDLVIATLYEMGTTAAPAIPELRRAQERESDEGRKAGIDLTLLRIGDDEPAARIAQRMMNDPRHYVGRIELAEVGPRARAAVPVLVDVLRAGQWDARAGAAQVLGFIRDERAAPALVAALSSLDWRVVHNAARALRRIGGDDARQGRARLAHHAERHWSKIVRDEAALAVRVLDGDVAAGAAADDEKPSDARSRRLLAR